MSKQEKLESAVYQLLEALGENPEREGLLDTPKRVAKMYQEMFSGLHEDPKDQFTAVFSENHDEIVLVKDIPFYSMCEHHLVPFYGKAHVAYLPSDWFKQVGACGRGCQQTPTIARTFDRPSGYGAGRSLAAKRGICHGRSRAYVHDHARH